MSGGSQSIATWEPATPRGSRTTLTYCASGNIAKSGPMKPEYAGRLSPQRGVSCACRRMQRSTTEPIVGGASATSAIARRRPIRLWISRRVRWRSSPKIHSAMRRRFPGSARSPKRTRCHHSSRMKFVSRGTPISGCMSSITCSSVVPDRGQPPMRRGRPARPAYADGGRSGQAAGRGRQPLATVGGRGDPGTGVRVCGTRVGCAAESRGAGQGVAPMCGTPSRRRVIL